MELTQALTSKAALSVDSADGPGLLQHMSRRRMVLRSPLRARSMMRAASSRCRFCVLEAASGRLYRTRHVFLRLQRPC